MKDAIIVSLTKEGAIGSTIYPFSEELFASLHKLESAGFVKVELQKVPACLM